MHQFFVPSSQITPQTVTITGKDVPHIKTVLRMKPGEELSISNGRDGKEYLCTILSMEEDQILCTIGSVREDGSELPSRVHLFQALPKADKMETIIQKTVELGVHEIIPVAARRCVVKLEPKKEKSRLERWQAIAEAAAKQSKRSIIPGITQVLSFGEALQRASSMDVKLIPYELAGDMARTRALIDGLERQKDIAVFIGPEGGFEEEEIRKAMNQGVVPITLGKRILRTETAGMTVMSWIMYKLEN